MLPGIHKGNIGTLTPDELLEALDLFELKFGAGDD